MVTAFFCLRCSLILQILRLILRQDWSHQADPDTNQLAVLIPIRMIYFSYLSSISYAFALLGPVLASATMSLTLWLPFYLGLGLSLSALPILLLLPRQSTQPRDHSQPCEQPPNDTDEIAPLISDISDQDEIAATSKHRMGIVHRLVSEVKTVCERPNFLKLIAIGMLLSIAGSGTAIYLLYLSKRYHRTFIEVRCFSK